MCSNRPLNFLEFIIEKDTSYLVRFGLAGPIGYGFYTAQFGILYLDRRIEEIKIALLEVDYSKEAEEEIKRIWRLE